MKKTIFRLLEYVGKYKGLMLLSVLSALISVVCTLYAPLIIGRAIDGMVAKGISGGARLLFLLAGVYLCGNLFLWLLNYLTNRISYFTVNHLRTILFDKLAVLPLGFYDQNAHGDISSRFIMENPNQLKKAIRASNDTEQYVLGEIQGYTDKWAIQFMLSKLEDLPQNSTVYFIGRYQFDSDLLKESGRLRLSYNNISKVLDVCLPSRPDLRMAFYTAHRSKGLQADFVFIINKVLLQCDVGYFHFSIT